MKQYIIDLDATGQFEDIEDARKRLKELADFARDHCGLNILDGLVAITREREPVESWHLGSDEPFRNLTAQDGTPQQQRFERTMTTA